MELKRTVLIILLICGILGTSFWAFYVPEQKQNVFVYAQNGDIFNVFTNSSCSDQLTSLNWGYLTLYESKFEGRGLYLNGNFFTNSCIEIPNSPSLSFDKSEGTITLLIKPNNTTSGHYQRLVTDTSWINQTYGGIEFAIQSDGDVYFYPAEAGGTNYNLVTNPLANNVWQHIAVTWEYLMKKVKIYVNGVEKPPTIENVSLNWNSIAQTEDWQIGGTTFMSSDVFDGEIDEVQIFSYALQDVDIKRLYNHDEFVTKTFTIKNEGTTNITNLYMFIENVNFPWLSHYIECYYNIEERVISPNQNVTATISLYFHKEIPSWNGTLAFSFDIIVYTSNLPPISLGSSDLYCCNTNKKLRYDGLPYIQSCGIFNVTTLDWTPKASWFTWEIIPSNKLSFTLEGNSSDNLKIHWENMGSNVKVVFSNGTKLNAMNFWNSTTKNINLGITINSTVTLSIYPEEIPRWYSWAWLIPSLVVAFSVILKRIKNPYAKLFTLVTIEDGFLRVSLILIGMPLLMCILVSITLDTIVHSIKQLHNFKRRFALALLYNAVWYLFYFVGSLWHWSVGILLGILFHFILDIILIKYKGDE